MDYQVYLLSSRIRRLPVDVGQPIIDDFNRVLDETERAIQSRTQGLSALSSQSSAEDRRLIERIDHFKQLNTAGPVTSSLTTAEGRAEYNDLLLKFHVGTISQIESELLWVLDYRFSRCTAKLAQDYRRRMNILMNANGSRSTSNFARQFYEMTSRQLHR